MKMKVVLLLVIPTILAFIWFRKGLMFGGGEEAIPFYNLTKYFNDISYVWHEGNAGINMIWLLPKVPYHWFLAQLSGTGVSNIFLQAFTFWILMVIGVFSMFYLIRDLVSRNFMVPLTGAIFYLLNPYSLVLVWGRGLYVQYFAFALIPLFLLLFIRAVNKNSLYYGSLTVLSSFILSAAFVFPAQIIVVWFSPLLYLFFYILKNRGKRKKIIHSVYLFSFMLIFFIAIHAWWLIPNIGLAQSQYAILLESTEYNLGSLRGVSREIPLHIIIRLLHNFITNAKAYGEVYLSPVFILISFLPTVALLLSYRKIRKFKYGKFFLALLVFSLFVVLGSNLPLGILFEFLFVRVSFLQAFRNPYEKFGLVYLLSYVPFFAIGISRLPRKITFALMLIYCGLYVWPLWTGQFAGGLNSNPWVDVPSYYQGTNKWLNGQKGDFRIIHMPLLPGDGLRYNWPNSYQGIEPSEYLFNRPSIARNVFVNKIYYNSLLRRFNIFSPNAFGPDPDISEAEFASDELYRELEKLNVRYIVLHHDIDTKLAGSKTDIETFDYLSTQRNISKVATFGELDIFEVKISNEVQHIYSPGVKTEFKKISPSQYNVAIYNVDETAELIFLELFDDGWEAFISGEKIESHSRVFSYANLWKLNRSGSYEIIIKHKPQDLVLSGLKVSFVSVPAIYLMVILWSRRLKENGLQ